LEVLILDLLEWLSARERSYEETMDAWRTSCPRLTVSEDANDRGFVSIEDGIGRIAASGDLNSVTDIRPSRGPRLSWCETSPNAVSRSLRARMADVIIGDNTAKWIVSESPTIPTRIQFRSFPQSSLRPARSRR